MAYLLALWAFTPSCRAGVAAGNACGNTLDHLITGHLLLSLWWSQLATFAVLPLLMAAAGAWLVLRRQPRQTPEQIIAVNISARLRQLSEN